MRQHIQSGRQEIESQVMMSGGKEPANSAGVLILTPCWPRRGLKFRVLPVITTSATLQSRNVRIWAKEIL